MEIFKKTWKRMTAFSLALILAMTAPQVPSGKVFATEKTQKQTEQKNELTTAESIAVKEEEVDELQGMETGEAIRYLERWWDDAGSVLKIGTGAVSEYTEVTEGLYTWEDGWYVVKSDVTLEQLVTVSGSVYLILMDDATLTAKRGIRVSAGNSLNIYAQSDAENMGKLVVTCGDNDNNEEGQAGIGGGKNQAGGEIVIHGGNISTLGGWGAAGIGGGLNGRGGDITIHGGKISAIGGTDTINTGAGIGGGSYGMGGNITINGGQITVTEEGSYADGAAGIGGGYYASGENIVIRGGTINVSTGDGGAGIGGGEGKASGEISIYGGEIITQGGYSAPGIGHGVNVYETTDEINIYGGNITSTGGSFASGIGGGRYGSGKVVIHDGTVTAIGGNYGAGIGGGDGGTGGEVVIYGGAVTATSGADGGAGIGGGYRSAGGNITIHGGYVTATGVDGGAGIGGGEDGNGGEIAIHGGTIIAVGLDETSWGQGAGIGGGYHGNGANLLITGGNIKAIMDTYTEGVMEGIGAGVGGSSEGTVQDANGNDLVLSTFSLCGVEEIVNVSSVTGDVEYGVEDVITLDNNVLYFYLPVEANVSSVVTGEKEYFGSLEIADEYDNKEGIYHCMTYEKGENDTILAGCSTEECDQNATIAIAAPEKTVFTGSAIEATSQVTPTGALVPEITYEAVKGSLTEGKPVNCGNYNAVISLGGIEIGTNYEITKKTPTVEDFLYTDPINLRYDGTQKIPTIIGAHSGMGKITISYYNRYDSNKTPMDAPVNVGSYAVKVNVEEGDNYTAIDGLESNNWRFGIDRANVSSDYFRYTAPDELIYDGKLKHAQVNAAEGIEGMGEITLSYYPVIDGVEDDEEVTPVNAGTYKVKISVAVGNNNNATTELLTDDNWTFTIERAATSIESVNGERNHATDKTIYSTTNVEDIVLTGTAVSGGQEIEGTFKLADSVTKLTLGTNSYDCVFIPNDGNYKSANGTVILTVEENAVTSISVENQPTKVSYIYGEYFDITGTVVKAAYEDGTIAEVTDDVTFADSILGKNQTEVELSFTHEGKCVTTKVTGIRVEYLEAPADILYQNAAKKEWYGSADGNVVVTADGYKVSDTLNGTYAESYTLNYEHDGICTKTLYFKNTLGQMTGEVEVEVRYDHSAPVFPDNGGIIIKEQWWNHLQNVITFSSAYKEAEVEVKVNAEDAGGSEIAAYHYYVDITGSIAALTAEELNEKTFVTTGSEVLKPLMEEGRYVYYIYVTDKAGNKSDYICSNGIVIDRTVPVITKIQVPENTLLDTSAALTAEAEDLGSNVKAYYLVYRDADLSDEVNSENIAAYEGVLTNTDGRFAVSGLAPNTTYNCMIGVSDYAGNIICREISFTTKKTMPVFDDADIPTISGTYSQALSKMKLSKTVATSKNNIAGTWSITAEGKESIYPMVGEQNSYEITFTPENTNAYSAYITTAKVQVARKQLTVKTVIAQSRDYIPDNNLVAITIELEGIVQGDTVTLVNANKLQGTLTSDNAGNYKEISLPTLTLTGESAGNYTLVQPESAVATNVTIRPLDAEITLDYDYYNKTFGDAAFTLAVTDTNLEADVQFEVTEGNDVLSVSNGKATILKAGAATITVSLPASTNYNAAESKMIAVLVNKKSGVTADAVNKSYLYLRENTDSINLNELLPSDCGNVEYAQSVITGDITYKTEPAVSNGVLTYTLNTGNVNEQGTITVTAVSENYTDTVIRVNLKLADRMPVTLKEGTEVTLKNNILTYGEKLAKLEFNSAVFVDSDGNEVEGNVTWKNSDEILNVGTSNVQWKFTPKDTQAYLGTEGSITITINKAVSVISIESGKTSYQKLFIEEDFMLEGITATGDGRIIYTATEGSALDGTTKNVEQILTVSDDGMVSLHGTGRVTINVGTTETSNYQSAQSQQITIEVIYADEFLVEKLEEMTYTGKALKPEIKVLDGMNENLLQPGKDYTVSYKNNTKAYAFTEGEEGFDESKAPKAIVKGKGNYSSVMTVYFTIQPKDISDLKDESIVVKDILLETNGKVQTKVPAITYNRKKLSGVLKPADGSTPAKVKDFMYSYPELAEDATKDTAFKEAGTWTVLVEGTGNYTGSRTVEVVIAPKGGKMSSVKIAKIPAQEYNGGNPVELDETELVVTAKVDGKNTLLVKGTHYSVEYKEHTDVGTATVIIKGIEGSGFAGTKTATFKIMGTSIAKAMVTGIEDKTYTGSEITQNLVITVKKNIQTENGTSEENVTLTEEDYDVTYDKNINKGTAKVTITGKGAYYGTLKKTFKIKAYDMTGETNAKGELKENSSLTESNGLFTKKDGEFRVKYVKGGVKPEVELVFGGNKLIEGRDYIITYKNNKNVYTLTEGDDGYKAAKAPTITIKGKGNFTGSISKTFVITGRGLQDREVPVTMTVDDKVVSTKKGGYISKPVLKDADGKVLKQGKDYTVPAYTMTNEAGEIITLGKKDTAPERTQIMVTVYGLGAYEGEEPLTATYVITTKDFTKIKAAAIQKPYTGRKVILTEADFYDEKGKSKITIGSGKNKEYLEYGKDFTIVEGSYQNNIQKGTASVTLRGISEEEGLYGGTKIIKFKVGTRGIKEWFWWW